MIILNIIQKAKDIFLTKKFLLFVFCGGMGTLTNMGISTLCSFRINPTLSYIFGYFCSSLVTYTLNSKLTFHERLSFPRYVRFVVSYIPNFLILFSFVVFFINILRWNHIFVYGFAAAFGLPLTYIIVRVVAFAKKNGDS